MDKDFFKEIEYFALTARLKRLSDNMLYSAKDLYKSLELDIAPNWHLVFLLFKKQETLTMTEIADAFQLSQAAVIKIINKMKANDYLVAIKDPVDNRKQQLRLSEKAQRELPKLEKVWQAGEQSIKDILQGNEQLLQQLSELEAAIAKQTYKERTLQHLERSNKKSKQ